MKYNQTEVSKPRKPSVSDSLIKAGILEFLEKKKPGPLTSYWEVKRAAEAYVKYHLKFEKDSMNAEMFEGIGIDPMHLVLREMEREGTIGWALETGSTWGAHYYLVSHRREKPEIAQKWCCSEYKDGKRITTRANSV